MNVIRWTVQPKEITKLPQKPSVMDAPMHFGHLGIDIVMEASVSVVMKMDRLDHPQIQPVVLLVPTEF